MPIKTKKIATYNSVSQENTLSFSSTHARINFLHQKHKKLLTQIKRKKTELSNLTQQIQTLSQEMSHKSRPFDEKIHTLDREIHSLFEKILSKKRLGKRQRQEIIDIYRTLQLTGRISLIPDYFFQSSSANFQDDVEYNSEDSTEKDFFGDNYYDDKNHSKFYEQPDISQPRPSRDLRKIFLKLADKFHPDKATDDETRILYTEIMKEINIAYKSGDLARLLEIEREKNQEKVNFHQNDSEKECERLGKEIELLSQQYQQVKAELREVKNTPQGNMVKQYRKAKKNGEDLMEDLLQQAELEVMSLKNLRDFVKDFKNKKITLQEFVQGPNAINIHNMEDMVNEMFEKMFIVIDF
ncbi:hypothetical protein [Dapis sp. BLCC M172]|uniref:J domain-containing protein n=1 Tax=Dapis sp. BLCC M172 TaxID=2975281 RepID=UPI003CEE300A